MAVGDVLNQNSNSLVVVTTEGWCYIYNNILKRDSEDELTESVQEGVEQVKNYFFFNVNEFLLSYSGGRPGSIFRKYR